MPSMTLVKALARAQDMRKHCEATPHLSLYQPAAASAVEVCVSATLFRRRNTVPLAGYAVKKTAGLIDIGAEQPHSGEVYKGLLEFERALDMMRARLDSEATLDQQRANISKALDVARFYRDCSRLKAAVGRSYENLLEIIKNPTEGSSPSKSESALEVASVGILAASTICDAPVLNFLKPALGTVALICETAKTVQGNRQSAAELANHARNVTAHVVDLAAPGCEDAMAPLCSALEETQVFLHSLRKRRRAASWMFARWENDRFARLNDGALDKALYVFSTSEVVRMGAAFRSNAKQLTMIVETVHRLEDNGKQPIRPYTNVDLSACDDWRAKWGTPAWCVGWPRNTPATAAALWMMWFFKNSDTLATEPEALRQHTTAVPPLHVHAVPVFLCARVAALLLGAGCPRWCGRTRKGLSRCDDGCACWVVGSPEKS
ncbi:hypothetical protein GGX14DRAFT_595582 [Mycena pura]|uniref:Uncharacterized protein n=1 Tax=Mycena pura TaxID=153505 RepID=A0AAD6VQ45_9AGAR|nr:hypothetical protein GGX14DRAFT_595582 [Mycena pura]